MNRQQKVKEILQTVRALPSISSSASMLLKVAGDPDHDRSDVVDVVKCDTALTAHLLKVVNSAAMALRVEVYSIDRAISILGEDVVISIALADAASHLFNCVLEGYEGGKGSLWRHDLYTAFATKKISTHAYRDVCSEIAFTSGLLHDMGKAIISDFLKDTSSAVVTAIEKGIYPDYATAEREIAGMDHSEVGYELAQHWRLPEPIPAIIRHHHEPESSGSEERAIVYSVHMGDMIAMMSGHGTGADSMQYELNPNYPVYIDLSSEELELILLEIDGEFRQMEAAFTSWSEL